MNFVFIKSLDEYRNYLLGLFKFMERWLPPPFNTGIEKYLISDSGAVLKLSRKSIAKYCDDTKSKLIKPQIRAKGYYRVKIFTNGKLRHRYVHRLVGLTFIENPENKPCINHKDGNKQNNHYTNLEWCTNAENNEHGFQMGLLKRCRNIKPYVSKKTEWGVYKPVIDPDTGIFYKTEELLSVVGTSKKYLMKMLRGERKNTTRYRYA